MIILLLLVILVLIASYPLSYLVGQNKALREHNQQIQETQIHREQARQERLQAVQTVRQAKMTP